MTIPDYWLMAQLNNFERIMDGTEMMPLEQEEDPDSEYPDGYDCADLYDDENPKYKED